MLRFPRRFTLIDDVAHVSRLIIEHGGHVGRERVLIYADSKPVRETVTTQAV